MADNMMWTNEQKQVIDLRDRSLLVSAAAGSGKTAVLVQRIIERICDESHPVDIDRLLVVTFTNAAAGEMRERVQAAIAKRVEEQPDNAHLRRQEVLAGHAHITTIDSFCLSVLREHFQEIELDPGFRIADEGELKLLQADVLEALLEEEYQEASESFLNFMEAYAPGKDDERAAELILQLYGFAVANPRPEDWLDHCLEGYRANSIEELEREPWMQRMVEHIKMILTETVSVYGRMIAICRDEGGMESYESVLLSEQQMVQFASEAADFSQLRERVNLIRFGSKPRKKKTDTFSEDKAKRVWEIREQAKKQLKALTEDYLADDDARLLQKQHLAGAQVQELVRLTHAFLTRYSAAKRKKNLVDFGDLEHLALDILSQKTADGEVPTATAEQYRESFEEIMIDEYQDSNYVQELILTSISRNDTPNLFMVGDVKQSIYRFRLARPELFMEKYASYTKEESAHQKIELHQNFRSRKSVLDSVNYFFYQLMHKSVGNVEYDKEAALYPGLVYEPCDTHPTGGATELLLLDLEDVPETSDEDAAPNPADQTDKVSDAEADSAVDTEAVYNSREWEAALIAQKIQEITDPKTGLYVWDKETKTYRLAEYRDIAILLRTVSGWAEEFIPVLLSKGIPAAADTGSGYFSAIEVQTVLNLLEIIDNPLQDIPLAAVMHSPIGHFSSEELAIVRAEQPPSQSKHLYDAAMAFVQKCGDPHRALAGKLRAFLNQLEMYRSKSRYLQLRELLVYVLEDSGYYEFVSAMPGASTRKANLDMLLERAGAFEKTSYQGVFQFVRYINRLKKYSVDYASAQELAQNQVRIMSIHKSKGLEFPICFVAGLGKNFNRQDVNSSMLFSVDYGIATDAIDPAMRTKESTVMKQAVRSELVLENLGEELRVLYVAMTRAKEKLYLTGAKDGLFNYLEKKIHETDKMTRALSYNALTTAGCFLDWITAAACKHKSFKAIYEQLGLNVPFDGVCYQDESPLSVSIVTKSSLSMQTSLWRAEEAMKRTTLENWKTDTIDEAEKELIASRFAVRYDDSPLARLQAAFTVSELKARHDEETFAASGPDAGEPIAQLNETLLPDQEWLPDEMILPDEELLPEFLQQKDKMSGAARGTLYHWLFEHFDFTGDLRQQLSYFMQQDFISVEERKRIRIADFDHFVQTPLGQKVKQAQKEGIYHREMPFILGVPASEMIHSDITATLSEKDANEYVSVQGVIDAWIDGENEITLIDFKTDRKPEGLTDEAFEELLRKRYHVQLDYYKRALEQMTKKSVKEAVLYSVSLGREISC
jgi:ATP-dependent helicase/nuclease subunit A